MLYISSFVNLGRWGLRWAVEVWFGGNLAGYLTRYDWARAVEGVEGRRLIGQSREGATPHWPQLFLTHTWLTGQNFSQRNFVKENLDKSMKRFSQILFFIVNVKKYLRYYWRENCRNSFFEEWTWSFLISGFNLDILHMIFIL